MLEVLGRRNQHQPASSGLPAKFVQGIAAGGFLELLAVSTSEFLDSFRAVPSAPTATGLASVG